MAQPLRDALRLLVPVRMQLRIAMAVDQRKRSIR
jgi:hypothetical protein